MRGSEPVSSWPSSTTSRRAPGVRSTQARTSSSGTVSSRLPAMQREGTRTTGKGGQRGRVLEEGPADAARAVGDVVVHLDAPLPLPARELGRGEPRPPPLVQAERRGEQHEARHRGIARRRQGREPAAEGAADDGVRAGGGLEGSLDDGEHRGGRAPLESVRTRGEVEADRDDAVVGESGGDGRGLGGARARREAVEVEDHRCIMPVRAPPYPKGDGPGGVRRADAPNMAPVHRRCPWT